MKSFLHILENVSKPLPLSNKLKRFFNTDQDLSYLECMVIFETHTQYIDDDNIILDGSIQNLFNISSSVINNFLFQKYMFNIIPLIIINTTDQCLLVNQQKYSFFDLHIDKKMFNIVLGNKQTFHSLPPDVIEYIKIFLCDGKLPFLNPYYFTIYEATDNYDAQSLSFWKNI